jgi:hypothetical protein
MPSQLKRRLERFLDASIASAVNRVRTEPPTETVNPPTPAERLDHAHKPLRNTHTHWLGGSFGQDMARIQSIMIHGTSGWPSYASAENFKERYQCIDGWDWADFPRPPHWKNDHGVGPQYFVDPEGTIYTLIGAEDLADTPLFTWHSEGMSYVSLGIENSDGADCSSIDPDAAVNAALFYRLDSTKRATDEDLQGRKVYGLLYPSGHEDLNLLWFALFPAYDGPGDTADMAHRYANWKNTFFTERDYRSLALLCRFLLERNGLPRNFPLYPWASSEFDTNNAAIFRGLLMADPLRDQIAAALGINVTVLKAGGDAFAQFYAPRFASLWSRFFGLNTNGSRSTPCFRGIISHLINGHHRCPGPMFDWHRFAREVWDWWWYPFDFDAQSTSSPRALSTPRRPYVQARGNTPLVEYYFDAAGQPLEYDALKFPLSSAEQFAVPATTPVYALANGIVVAARLATAANPTPPGFLLVRHEVFHEGTPDPVNEVVVQPPTDQIDYDTPPTYVWSLISFLSSPAANSAILSQDNPDWLNRFAIRLKECELAILFHNANPTSTALTRAWGHAPPSAPGAGTRPTTGTLIERDAEMYRTIANDLFFGQVARFPLESDANHTSVRVLLGDFLGLPSLMPGGSTGIQVEIFSREQLDVTGAVQRPVSAAAETWWRGVTAAARTEALPTAELPDDGNVWQYPLTSFLDWLNTKTWKSERLKYGANLSTPRPNPRINF